MRKVNLMAAVIVACGGLVLHAPSASAIYQPPPEKLFQYCCKSPEAYCCSRNGCEINATSCTRF